MKPHLVFASLTLLSVLPPARAQNDYERPATGPSSGRTAGDGSYQLSSLAWEYGRADGEAAVARQRLRDAEYDLTVAIARMQQGFNNSAQTVGARRAIETAWQSLQSARQTALRDLPNDQRYRALWEKRDQLSRLLATPGLSSRLRFELASAKLDISTEMSRAEAKVLEGNQAVDRARRDLVAAGEKLEGMRTSFRQSIPTDPTWSKARANVELARREVQDASIRLSAASAAYDQALDDRDAEYAIRYRYRNVYDPWYGYGYYPGSSWSVVFPRGMRR